MQGESEDGTRSLSPRPLSKCNCEYDSEMNDVEQHTIVPRRPVDAGGSVTYGDIKTRNGKYCSIRHTSGFLLRRLLARGDGSSSSSTCGRMRGEGGGDG